MVLAGVLPAPRAGTSAAAAPHSSMKLLLAIAAGGAVGALARFASTDWFARTVGTGFPFGTLFVNVAGSFAMAVLVELLATKLNAATELRAFLVVGVLGSFTTFSTFSHDVAALYERGELLAAGGYMGASVGMSVLALFSGLWITRAILA